MSDVVTEKLTQRVINLIDEVGDVNMLVRRLPPAQETLNKINERNDAIHAAIVHIEKGLKLDDKRLTALEEQAKSLEAALEIEKEQTKLLREAFEEQKNQSEQFKQTVQTLELVMRDLEGKINGHTAKLAEDLRGRIERATYLQVKWLIIVGAALFFVLALLVFRH